MSLNFDGFTLVEIPVTILGKKYLIREASGDAACKYRNAVFKSTTMGPDGKPVKIEGLADVQPLLVSLCLYLVGENGEVGQLVPLSVVRSWPDRIIRPLFQEIKRISVLDDTDDVETMNRRDEALKN